MTALAFLIGVTAGFAAAVGGGWLDTILSRLVDLILSMPQLIFALVICRCMGSSLTVLVADHRAAQFADGVPAGAGGRR